MNKILVTNKPNLVVNNFNLVNTDNLSDISEIKLAFEYESSFSDKIKAILIANNINLIGGVRLDKLLQSIFLEKHNIPHPKTYFDRTTFSPFNDIITFDSYTELDEIVVKPVLGARGVGVKKITRSEYKRCLENYREVSKVFKEEKKMLYEMEIDIDDNYIETSFRGSMLVQEPVDVSREFRLLVFKPNDFLIYERGKNENQFCGNLSYGSEPLEVDQWTLDTYITPLLPKLHSLMDELKYPWLSVDVYIDKCLNTGVFEFQMEFAYEGFKPKEVKQLMVKSIEYFLSQSK